MNGKLNYKAIMILKNHPYENISLYTHVLRACNLSTCAAYV